MLRKNVSALWNLNMQVVRSEMTIQYFELA